jgi:hypothetical protein
MLDVFLQMFCIIVHCTTVDLFFFLSFFFECIVSTLYRFFFSLSLSLTLGLSIREKLWKQNRSKCTLMNENEKGKKKEEIFECVLLLLFLFISFLYVYIFFLRNVFLCGHTKKNVYLFLWMDVVCVCV